MGHFTRWLRYTLCEFDELFESDEFLLYYISFIKMLEVKYIIIPINYTLFIIFKYSMENKNIYICNIFRIIYDQILNSIFRFITLKFWLYNDIRRWKWNDKHAIVSCSICI